MLRLRGGRQRPDRRGGLAPVAWYSKNLSTWARAPLATGAYSPAGAAGSHQVLAVTAAGPGFVAVGSAGIVPAAWTSRTGSAWRFSAVPLPAGTVSAVLTKVTAAGGRVLAAGYAWRAGLPPASGRPFTAVSADGGRTWRDSMLPAPPRPTVVTALATAGHGFVVAGRTGQATVGQAGPQAGQVMLVWWSADGQAWPDGVPVGGGPWPGLRYAAQCPDGRGRDADRCRIRREHRGGAPGPLARALPLTTRRGDARPAGSGSPRAAGPT